MPASALTPNDPTWSAAWGQRQVNMPKAWDISTGSANTIIASIDTGIDPTLPDLQGALVPGWDFVDNDAAPLDTQGHGTGMATIAVGRGNDGQGIAGYCWRCRLMPIRVAASTGNWDPLLAAAGIRWAVDHGARIIYLSFGDEATYPEPEPNIAAAIAYAYTRNVLVVASAGNTGGTNKTHPASDPGAFAVAGTAGNDALYPWSTWGPWIHLAAPGCQVVIIPDGWYGEVCGNSTTAPAVAGIAGLMLSVNPQLTPEQLVAALRSTALPVAGIDGGRVDAYRALIAVGGRVPAPPPPPASPPPAPPASRPPPPPPPAAARQLRQPSAPKMATRVRRGSLGRHKLIRFNLRAGRVAATLRSAKASSCSLSLNSNRSVWIAAADGRRTVALAAKVPAGRYKVDIWCSVRRPMRFALVLRARFAS